MEVKPARRKIVGSISTTRPSASALNTPTSTPPPSTSSYHTPASFRPALGSSVRSAPSSVVGAGTSKVRAINAASSSTARARVKVQPSSVAGGSTYSMAGGESSWDGGGGVRAHTPGATRVVAGSSASSTGRSRTVHAGSVHTQTPPSSSRPGSGGHVRANSGSSVFVSAPSSSHFSSSISTTSPSVRGRLTPVQTAPSLPRSVSSGFHSLPRPASIRPQLLPSAFPPTSSPSHPPTTSPPTYFNSIPPLPPDRPDSPPPLLSPHDISPTTARRRSSTPSSSLSSDSPDSKSAPSTTSNGYRHLPVTNSPPSSTGGSSHPLSPTFSSLSAARAGVASHHSPSLSVSTTFPFLKPNGLETPHPHPPPQLPSFPSNALLLVPVTPSREYSQPPRFESRESIGGGSSLMGGYGEDIEDETPEMEEKRKEKEEAKVNRKIADLEISNASLLAVNRMLEATKAKQAKEIRDLRRRLRTGSVQPVLNGLHSSAFGFSRSRLNGEEGGDNEDDDSEEEEEDEQFLRLKTTMLNLLERGQQAIDYIARPPARRSESLLGAGEGGGGPGGRVLGILEVEKWHDDQAGEAEGDGEEEEEGNGDLSLVLESEEAETSREEEEGDQRDENARGE